jgi:hypothetical protein
MKKPYQDVKEEYFIEYEILREQMILERKLTKWLKNEFSKFASQHP